MEDTLPDLDERLSRAEDLARQAGALLLEGFGRAHAIQHKGTDRDLVTAYDLHAEKLLVEGIRQTFPGDTIVGEETGRSGHGEAAWLIDPLDGTTNFAHGLPLFSVSIAFMHAGVPQCGVVYTPVGGDIFTVSLGGGAWLNGGRISVSAVDSVSESLLVTGFPYDLNENPDNNLDEFSVMSHHAHGVRRLGSAALDLAYVAAGQLDGFWELRLEPWDVAAGMLLVKEAGGMISRLDGRPDVLDPPVSILATNGRIHAEMLRLLDRS